jgi:ribosomal RNA-processing protein 12
VSQNKSVLSTRTDAGESNSYAIKNSVLDFGNVPTYSKKTATKNIRALTSCSTELLMALTDLFVDSHPEKRSYLKVLHLSLIELMLNVLIDFLLVFLFPN